MRSTPPNSSWNPAEANCMKLPRQRSPPLHSLKPISQLEPCLALQWNIRGLRSNVNELKQLITKYSPSIIAMQETKVKEQSIPPSFIGRNYTLLLKSGDTSYWQHGVGLAIREDIPFERMELNSDMQFIAVRIKLPIPMTVISLYIPPNKQNCCTQLLNLLEQLNGPVLILGDFNAHHPVWGSKKTSQLGTFIVETTLARKLIVLNDGSPTRIDPGTGHVSHIDLSICSECIAPKLIWHILEDTCGSDHLPVLVTIPGHGISVINQRRWQYDNANWDEYERITSESIRPGHLMDVETFTEKIVAAAEKTIPRTSGKSGPKAVPWWCPEVKAAVKLRRKKLRALRKLPETHPKKVDALKSFQEAQSASRKAVIKAKDESWKAFVSKIAPSSTSAELWRNVNTLRGKRLRKSPILKKPDGYTNNPLEIAEELALYYTAISATANYPASFQKAKEKAERTSGVLSPNTNDDYNSDLTLSELLWALDKGKSSSTGPDFLGYPMLQRLPASAKIALLELLNEVWRSGVYPTSWRVANIVPIPKPNSTDEGPAAFRPISLTSCLAKVFERIVNRRLIEKIEASSLLDNRQHAFRSGRGVNTYFTELENILPSTNEHCLIASLDLSKAYDTTWRYGIVRSLRKWRFRGRMLNIVQSFLADRFFHVTVGGCVSNRYPLENGVPQGSVLAVTLFLIAMQPIFRAIPDDVHVLLYADDILLAVKANKDQPLYSKLQASVKAVETWTRNVGFTISASKSRIFYCSPNARRGPRKSITIARVPVPRCNLLKVLGVTIDRKLTFKPHCKTVKSSSELRIRILKVIGGRVHRGNRSSLLLVGSTMVISRLFYGMGLISRGGQAIVAALTPIYNRVIRLASGAFIISPTSAILVESGVLPFDLLWLQQLVRLAIRLLETDSRNRNLPLVSRAIELLEKETGYSIPNIATLARTRNRQWNEPKPSVIWNVKQKVNAGDHPQKVRPVVLELLSERFQDATLLYTDGSKRDDAVGVGIHGRIVEQSIGLPPQCSIFSAEAYAIQTALRTCQTQGEIVVLSDSASCLAALEAGTCKHPWIQNIEASVRDRNVHFCWIPGHAGVRGNEEADRLANAATRISPIDIPIPATDVFKKVRETLWQLWDRKWFSTDHESCRNLREIKNSARKWRDIGNPPDQRTITRLRIGYTRLTHGWRIARTDREQCECCGCSITVRHLLIDCKKYEKERKQYGISSTSLQEVLANDSEKEENLLMFLKETELYKKI